MPEVIYWRVFLAFPCPRCSIPLRIDDPLAGRKVRCRGCAEVVIAPLYDEDPGFRIVEKGLDPDALRALLPTPARAKSGRKIALAAGFGLLVVALAVVAWYYLVPRSPLPDIVQELPEGDSFFYRTTEGAAFFRADGAPFAGTREIVTLRRGGTLTVYGGEFRVGEIAGRLGAQGYAARKRDGETLHAAPTSAEVVWLSRRRILVGQEDFVLEGLRALRGQGRRFLDGLAPALRRTLERTPQGALLYFGKSSPSAGEMRGLLRSVGAGSAGIACGVRLRSPTEAEVTLVLGYGGDGETRWVRDSAARVGEFVEDLRIECRDHACVATGRVKAARLD